MANRFHSSDDMMGLPELADVYEPVAVVIRPDGSLDVYGYVGIVDQRPCEDAQGNPCSVPELDQETSEK